MNLIKSYPSAVSLFLVGMVWMGFQNIAGTSVRIESNVEGASVWIDGQKTEFVTPVSLNDVQAGKHSIRIEFEGNTVEQSVDIKKGVSNQLFIPVKPTAATELIIRSNVFGANISIDGKVTSQKTPGMISGLSKGKHQISLNYDGRVAEQEVEVTEGERNQVYLLYDHAFMGLANIAISSNKPGADIRIDGIELPLKTPAIIEGIKAGKRKVVLQYEGKPAVFEIHVAEGRKNNFELNFPVATLSVTSNVEGADVLLDGKVTPYWTPCTLRDMIGGKYEVQLLKGGKSVSKTIFVNEGSNELSMAFPLGSLTVRSNVIGAEISIDGESVLRQTPATLTNQIEGPCTVTIEKNGQKLSQIVTIVPGKDTPVDLNFSLGTLKLRSNIAGAEIFLNDRKTGKTTPADLTDIVAGDYQVSLKKDGQWVKANIPVRISADTTAEMRFPLGNLTIESSPSDAQISVNGRKVDGKTPFTLHDLIAGTYKVLVEKNNTRSEREVRVSADSTEKLTVVLDTIAYGRLSVTSNIPGALIYMNSSNSNRPTPAVFDRVVTGSYTIKIALGDKTMTKTITVLPNQSQDVYFTIPVGNLVIKSDLKGGQIMVNGRPVGTVENNNSTFVIKDLQEDTYEVRAEKDAIKISKSIPVKAGQDVVVELNVSAPGNKKTWYYVAGGAAIIGGAVMFLTKKDKASDPGIPAFSLPGE